jgi:hypothetical protein
MKKQELIETILAKVEEVDCSIIRIYGVPFGVGFDLDITITTNDWKQYYLPAHAVPRTWAMPGHLRSHQRHQYDYKGQGDVGYYEEKVIEYWESKRALGEYLARLSKPELEELLLTLNG